MIARVPVSTGMAAARNAVGATTDAMTNNAQALTWFVKMTAYVRPRNGLLCRGNPRLPFTAAGVYDFLSD